MKNFEIFNLLTTQGCLKFQGEKLKINEILHTERRARRACEE